MKYILIIICLLGMFKNTYAQNVIKEDLLKYEQVYDYLKKDSTINNQSFSVSDTLVFMEKSLFWKFFQQKDESSLECLNRIDSIDQQERFTRIYSSELANRFSSDTGKSNLYFSKVSENILFAEYFYRFGMTPGGVNLSSKFNAGCRYLFVFDENNNIQDVLRQFIAYK
ncbi:MAG: hypothetical protein ACK5KL_12305 [Dysgonomonas sp.]